MNGIADNAEGRFSYSTWVGREEFGHVPEHKYIRVQESNRVVFLEPGLGISV